ncbi:MAG TPA: hypothetical protein VGR69_07625 [Candidatus Rubrimentiphilum sp.]|nr:hypothetical protein [Candidatus Rubrimentiphilum sp.]
MKTLAIAVAILLLAPLAGWAAPAKRSHHTSTRRSTKSAKTGGLNPLTHCGTERWHIKTLDDADAVKIKAPPQVASVHQMRALPVPSGFDKNNDTSRYVPVEETEYTVSAILVGFKEESDRDLHIVLADPSSPADTMIGEVPDPQCSTVAASGHATQIAKVRNAFIKCFGTPPVGSLMKFSGKMIAQLTGVGFFDVLHGQTGVAPNGLEIHPIVKVKTVSGSCPTG